MNRRIVTLRVSVLFCFLSFVISCAQSNLPLRVGSQNGSNAIPTPPQGGGGAGSTPTPTPPSTNSDPAFYATPAIAGTGVRLVKLSPTSGQTLQQAMDAAQPGDIIELGAGTYASHSRLSMNVSGTPANWILIRGAAGTRPIIDLLGASELNLGASYISLENVEIKNGGGNNLHISPSSTSISNIVVNNVYIHSLASGPGAAIKINSNVTINATIDHVYIESSDLSQSIGNALVDGVAVSEAVVRNCYLHDNEVGAHGIFFKGGSVDVLLENNFITRIYQNAVIQLGGVTGNKFFGPVNSNFEGKNQVVRNNLIADIDDAPFQIQGVINGKIYNNTAVMQSGFAIFRFLYGNSSSCNSCSPNSNIDITNNLIISTNPSAHPQYARNDGNTTATNFKFGKQLWGGNFVNSSAAAGTPSFPQPSDVVVSATNTGSVVTNPSYAGLNSIAQAKANFVLKSGSPAKNAGDANTVVSFDILQVLRSTTNPSIGAFE